MPCGGIARTLSLRSTRSHVAASASTSSRLAVSSLSGSFAGSGVRSLWQPTQYLLDPRLVLGGVGRSAACGAVAAWTGAAAARTPDGAAASCACSPLRRSRCLRTRPTSSRACAPSSSDAPAQTSGRAQDAPSSSAPRPLSALLVSSFFFSHGGSGGGCGAGSSAFSPISSRTAAIISSRVLRFGR